MGYVGGESCPLLYALRCRRSNPISLAKICAGTTRTASGRPCPSRTRSRLFPTAPAASVRSSMTSALQGPVAGGDHVLPPQGLPPHRHRYATLARNFLSVLSPWLLAV